MIRRRWLIRVHGGAVIGRACGPARDFDEDLEVMPVDEHQRHLSDEHREHARLAHEAHDLREYARELLERAVLAEAKVQRLQAGNRGEW